MDTTTSSEIKVWAHDEGDRLWVFPESKNDVGSGGEFNIYVDHDTTPEAAASFARFSLGVGGKLSEHRHERTEEMGYLISGQGVLHRRVDDELEEVPLLPGHVWHIAPRAWHALSNTGTDKLVLVFATIPNHERGLLSFFRKIGTLPGTEPKALTPEEIARLGAEHDFVVRGGD